MEYSTQEYQRWKKEVDVADLAELQELEKDPALLQYRFSGAMQFGTAGLRSVMGMGLQAMNVYTVRHATQALANVILESGQSARGVVIAWDSRNHSEEFARESACVMAANEIPVWFFDSLRPTPLLSYAVRKLGCIAGINITASHNPKEYNGYKAYWEDGAQLSNAQARKVAEQMERIDLFADIKRMEFADALAQGKITVLPPSFDQEYLDCILEQAQNKNNTEQARDLSIVYTPLHGAGYRLVPQALRRAGFDRVVCVAEQSKPNGEFPTVPYPNPEEAQTFELAQKYAKENDSDLLIATDPDADRIGVTLRRADGSFWRLTGNQVGALLSEYLLCSLEDAGKMPENPYMVTTIVSTPMLDTICRAHGAFSERVFTGFRFIGEAIRRHEEAQDATFLLAFEESYGYLKGTYARDKDAVEASVLVCEMAAYYHSKGKTLADAMQDLYRKYGYYLEKTVSIPFGVGTAGKQRMAAMMANIRKNPPKTLGGETVTTLTDYYARTVTDLRNGDIAPCAMERSDVLYFETEAHNVLVVRPSGTEPKVKVYYLLHADNQAQAQSKLEAFQADMAIYTQA